MVMSLVSFQHGFNLFLYTPIKLLAHNTLSLITKTKQYRCFQRLLAAHRHAGAGMRGGADKHEREERENEEEVEVGFAEIRCSSAQNLAARPTWIGSASSLGLEPHKPTAGPQNRPNSRLQLPPRLDLGRPLRSDGRAGRSGSTQCSAWEP